MVMVLPPSDLSALSGLIELLRDPDKAQAHIHELKQAHQAFAETRDEAQKLCAQNQKWSAALVSEQEELARQKQEFEAARKQWDADRTATSNEIAKSHENLRVRHEEVAEIASRLVNEEAALKARIRDVQAREQALAEATEKNRQREADLASRLNRIKEAAA